MQYGGNSARTDILPCSSVSRHFILYLPYERKITVPARPPRRHGAHHGDHPAGAGADAGTGKPAMAGRATRQRPISDTISPGGYGWVFEKPEAGKSTDARGTDGTGAAGFRAVTAAAGKTTGTEAAGKTGVSGADETAAAAEEAEKAGEAGGRGETEPAKAAAAQGNVIAYGAVVFRRGTRLRRHRRGMAHRRRVCRTAPHGGGRTVRKPAGWRRSLCGASKRWRTGAARAVCASTPISTTVTCCACSDGWGSSIAARYATGAANGWHSRNPSGHEGIKRGNRPYGRFPLQDECVTIPCNNSPGEIS